MLGIPVVPSVIYTVLCFTLPESPRWLIVEAKQEDLGKAVFAQINPTMSDSELDTLVESDKDSAKSSDSEKNSKVKFFTKKLRYPILFASLIAAFNQLSGINIILYFAPRLLGLAGMKNPIQASIALGVTNLIATFIGIRLIDLLCRKTLLIIGCIGYIVSLSVCTYAFFHYSELKVISNAIDTASSADHLLDIKNGTVYFTPEDEQNAVAAFNNAKAELKNVTATPLTIMSRMLALMVIMFL